MAMPALQLPARTDWTAAEVRDFPDDGNRYEVVDGELLVSPSPRLLHQRACAELDRALHPYVGAHRLGEVLRSPADIEFDPRTLVQPDVFVVPLVDGRRPRNWTETRALSVAIEVLSPSTARADRTIKRRKYQAVGTPEYWIVDLDARLVERWTPCDERPAILTDQLEWQPTPGATTFVLDLAAFFAEVLEDPSALKGH
jgi:Uma2 family endonuclease